MIQELRVPNQGPYSGFEKGMPICPECGAVGTIEYPDEVMKQTTIGGVVEDVRRPANYSRCTACLEIFDRHFKFQKR